MIKLKGIGNAGGAVVGIAIGRACILRERDSVYEQRSMLTPCDEYARFEAALERFTEEIRTAVEAVCSRAGDRDAAILEGQLLMLADPILRGEINEMLDGGATAEYAVAAVLESYIIVFTASEDELTRQRAADVRDVKNALLAILCEEKSSAPPHLSVDSILVADELSPSILAAYADAPPVGILTAKGSLTAHVAILSKTMGIPAVFALGEEIKQIVEGDVLILDGRSGEVILSPDCTTEQRYAICAAEEKQRIAALDAFVHCPTQSADGRIFRLFCNIGRPEDAALVRASGGEGIGLMRSEFLFMERSVPPNEEEQYQAYRTVVEAMEGKPMIIRTLDIGGDKAIPCLGIEREENPFLGFRAIRYCLQHEALFKTQLRAILRAAMQGDVRVMLPFVISLSEVRAAKAILDVCARELGCASIPLGIMIETPAAVLTAEILAREVDFFSIGTNDLTQYILTADRGNPATASLCNPFHPAVLSAIAHTVKTAKSAGISVGICGEIAADSRMLPLLMAMEFDELSVSPSAVLACRAGIASLRLSDAKALLARVLASDSVEKIEELLQK